MEQFFNLSVDMLGIVSAGDGSFKRVNPAFCRTLGWSEQDLLSMRQKDLIHPEDLAIYQHIISDLLPGKQPEQFEFRLRCKDGAYKLAACSITSDPDRGLMFCVCRDMTQEKAAERSKNAEAALRDMGKKYRLLAENTADVIYKLRIEDQKCVYASPSIERLLGYTPEEALSLSVQEVMPPKSYETQLVKLSEAIASNSRDFEILELEMIHKDGHIVPVEINVSLIFDDYGRPIEIQGICRDITERKRAETALRQNEATLRTFISECRDGIIMINRQGKIVEWNRGEALITGISREAAMGQYLWDIQNLLAPEAIRSAAYVEAAREKIMRGFEEGTRLKRFIEEEIERPDGTRRDVHSNLFAIQIGGSLLACGICRDVTHLKHVEEELRQSEKKYRDLLDNMNEVLFVLDRSGRVSFVCSAVSRLAQYNPSEVIGHFAEDFIYKEDLPRFRKNFKAALEGKKSTENQYRIVTGTGDIKWVETSTRQVYAGIEITGVQGLFLDITERKRAEEALKENEERFRAVFDNAAVGMALVDLAGHILKVNEAFCGFLGYAPQELANMHFSEITHPEDLETDVKLAQELIGGARDSYMLDKRYLRKNGEVVWGRLGVSIIRDGGGSPMYGLGTCEDITARKAAEDNLKHLNEFLEQRVAERTAEAEQRAEALRQLALELSGAEDLERRRIAMILHDDLQQYLAAIRFRLSSLIRDTQADPKTAQRLFSAESLLIESIQKCRSLSHELSPPVLHQNGLIAALGWLSKDMGEKHGLEVALHTEPGAEPVSPRLASALFRSIRELLFNIVKHAGTDRAEIHVNAKTGQIQFG